MPSGESLRAARAIQDWAESSECCNMSREEGIVAQAEFIDAECMGLVGTLQQEVATIKHLLLQAEQFIDDPDNAEEDCDLISRIRRATCTEVPSNV